MLPTKLPSLTFPVPVLAISAAALVGYLTFSSMRETIKEQEQTIATVTASRDQALSAAEQCSREVAQLQSRQESLQAKLVEVEAKAKKMARKEQDSADVVGNARPEYGTSTDIDDYKSSVALINAALKRIQELKK